jgi:hypothetical protein
LTKTFTGLYTVSSYPPFRLCAAVVINGSLIFEGAWISRRKFLSMKRGISGNWCCALPKNILQGEVLRHTLQSALSNFLRSVDRFPALFERGGSYPVIIELADLKGTSGVGHDRRRTKVILQPVCFSVQRNVWTEFLCRFLARFVTPQPHSGKVGPPDVLDHVDFSCGINARFRRLKR